jgi:protein-disulfide isomerase
MSMAIRRNPDPRSGPRKLSGPLTVAAFLLLGCSGGGSQEQEVLATVDGDPVTMSDVEELVGDRLGTLDYQYRRQRYDLIEAAIERAVRERLVEDEAAARGIEVEELIASEVGASVEVTEEEIEAWYNQNQAAVGGRSLEEISTAIGQFLRDSRRERAVSQFIESLKQGRDVVVHLDPFRVKLDNSGSPAIGPSDAPVTLVEFSDFECPYCARFYHTLKQLAENYSGKIRIVYRQFPINTHPNAQAAAVASLCADEQGQFWAMHDLMFEEQDQLDEASLKEKAERLGLDTDEFAACLDSGRHDERIQKDIREASRVGVDGTPAIFVNGIPLAAGAVPYSAVAQAIDAELERAGFR